MNKKILIMIILIIIVVGSSFAFIYYKKSSTKNSVVEYLTTEKNIPKKNIIQSKPFIVSAATFNVGCMASDSDGATV